MCGIIGYVGHQQAAPILLDGLARMEYRGYDSAGVAVRSETKGLQVYKSKGRLQVLSDMIHGGADVEGTLGIGHTRWATHGEPNDINAHPHVSEDGRIAMVHNGIIENYMEIKQQLLRHGVTFKSETDTEVAAQLLEFWNDVFIDPHIGKIVQLHLLHMRGKAAQGLERASADKIGQHAAE